MSVDFPEPEGPQTTMTSPFWTFVVQSVSTWKAPYHLLTFWISIIAMISFLSAAMRLLWMVHQRPPWSAVVGSGPVCGGAVGRSRIGSMRS